MGYIVRVYDNFHYMDEDEAYDLPPFETADEVLAYCRRAVDSDLEDYYKLGMTMREMLDLYHMFGVDPMILAVDGSPAIEFSAWTYAEQRCRQMCVLEPGQRSEIE